MSVPENQELSQALKLQQMPCKFSGVIPIKKRRFPIVSPEEKSFSSENDVKSEDKEESDVPEHPILNGDPGDTKKDYNIPVKGMVISDVKEMDSSGNLGTTGYAAKESDSYGELDVSTTVGLAIKQELVTDNVELTQATGDTSPEIRLGSDYACRNKQNKLLSNECEVTGISLGPHIVNAIQEIVCKKSEGDCLLKPCIGPKNVEMLSGEGEPSLPTPEHSNRELIFPVLNKIELPYLSSSVEVAKQDSMNGVSCQQVSNRSNWDLNTTMDVWGVSACDSRIDDRISGNDSQYVTSTFSAPSVVRGRLSIGKQVLSEYSCNASAQPDCQQKPNDILGLTLATFCSDVMLSTSQVNMDSSNVSLDLCCGGEKLSTSNVKTEPDCRTRNSINMALSKSCPTERVVENLPSKVVFSTFNSQPKSYDNKSKKIEPYHEDDKDTSNSMDAIPPQPSRKIMQHQESSAFSSFLSIPSSSRNSCPLEFLTLAEPSIIRSISTQSEPLVSCIESPTNRIILSDGRDTVMVKSVEQIDRQLRVFKTEGLNVHGDGNSKAVPGDDLFHELSNDNDKTATNKEKSNICPKMFRDDSFGFDCESYRNRSAATCMDVVDKIPIKDCIEYKNDEHLEQLEHPIGEEATEAQVTENVRIVECDNMGVNLPNFVVDQNKNTTDFDGNSAKTENDRGICSGQVIEQVMNLNEPKYEVISLPIPLSEQGKDIHTDDDKSISVITDKDLDLSGRKTSEMNDDKEVSTATNGGQGQGITLECDASEKDVEGIWQGKHEPSVSKEDRLVNTCDPLQDSNTIGNRKRIINLSRGSLASTPIKKRSSCSKFLMPRTGKEICTDFDKELPQGNRDVHYVDGPNKFFRNRVHEQPFRNSRQCFMRYKNWRPDHEHSSESSNGKIDYQGAISDELKCDDYGTKPDGISFFRCKRKMVNDEWPLLSRPHFRRFSQGDKNRVFRGNEMSRICHRNLSSNRWSAEDDSDFLRPLHNDRFMQCISDDIYDEVDDQHVRGNENFPYIRKKNFSRSKSPVRSRIRSPGLWQSSHHRSIHEISGSPVLHRMGRMRSPDRARYQNKLFHRRHITPSFIDRRYELRDMESEREHSYTGDTNSNGRIPFGHTFQKRAHGVNSLSERDECEEYSEGPARSNKFQEVGSDEGIDERRNFRKRNGYIRPFLPNSTPDIENYHIDHDRARPYRFSGYRNRVFEQKQDS